MINTTLKKLHFWRFFNKNSPDSEVLCNWAYGSVTFQATRDSWGLLSETKNGLINIAFKIPLQMLTYSQWRIYKWDWGDIFPGPIGKKVHF
jgi:hypothetical protein